MSQHSARKHSKFSASGAERWFNCPGSVLLSEGQPDKETKWSREGTLAHEVLELQLRDLIEGRGKPGQVLIGKDVTRDMIKLGFRSAQFIYGEHRKARGSDILVETRIYLPFIHPEMFGTFDGAVLDHFGVLHVFDYKYGQGHSVGPVENLQMIFYGLGLAAKYDWNFSTVRLWIVQPRIKGYDGPIFWDLSITKLRAYVGKFGEAVERVEREPRKYKEGKWCHWCKAKTICPLKKQAQLTKAKSVFANTPIE